MPAENTTYVWNNVNSMTNRAAMPRVVDQIFKNTALLRRLKADEEELDGGQFITQHVSYAEGPGGPFEGMSPHDVSEVEQITDALFNWKHYYVSITIRRSDELKNRGKNALGKLLTVKVKIAEKTMRNLLAQGCYSTGADPLAITGLRAMVTGTGTTYGNISKTTNDWWRAQVDATTTVLSIPAMRTLMGDCTIDAESPNLIIGTQAIYNSYYYLLQPQQRFASEQMAKGGFTSILFEGRPLVVDHHCPAMHLYFLNMDEIKLVSHEDENMRFEPFRRPFRQAGRSAFIYWFGNLTGSACRLQGVMDHLTS